MAYKKFTASEEMLKPDPRFNSKLVSKFINCLMWDGKKTVAQGIFYGAMDIVKDKLKDVPPLEVFETAINNIKPFVEVRSRRVGGANYQLPLQGHRQRQQPPALRWHHHARRRGGASAQAPRRVTRNRQQSLASRWLLAACRDQGGRPMSQRLADELL